MSYQGYSYETSRPINERKVTRCGVPALIITVLEGVTLAPAVVAIGVLAFAHSVTLKADLLNMEQAQAKWEQEIHELEEPRAHLEAALAQLSEDSKLIVSCFIIQMIETETDLECHRMGSHISWKGLLTG